MLAVEDCATFLNCQERAPQATLVTVDYYLIHLVVIADVDLIGEQTLSAAGPNLRYQYLGVFNMTNQVSIDVDLGPNMSLVRRDVDHPAIAEKPMNILLPESFRYIDDERRS